MSVAVSATHRQERYRKRLKMTLPTTGTAALAEAKLLVKSGDLVSARARAEVGLRDAPEDHRLYAFLAFVAARESKPADAIHMLLRAIELNASISQYWDDLWFVLERTDTVPDRRLLCRVIERGLTLDRTARVDAELAAHRQLLPKLRACGSGAAILDWVLGQGGEKADDEGLRSLFPGFLEFGATRALEMEQCVTSLRRELLMRNQPEGAPQVGPEALELCAALAIHCFFHEHIFEELVDETTAIEALVARAASGQTTAIDVARLAAYRPLRNLECGRALPGRFIEHESARLQKLLKLDVLDWVEEGRLRSRIEPLTPIEDRTSQVVRAQYEENPYPRWNHLPVGREANPRAGAGKKILVAGCGTGHHALLVASRFPAAEIWAMDLSAASLAYALRAATEYGFHGLRFLQGDILELGSRSERFDEIYCEGVLHHLRDPERGLATLSDSLSPNGQLRLAVYSNSGRRWIPPATALRDELGLKATLAGIRRLRAAIASRPEGDPARGVIGTADFYTTSACRDLLFHVREHRYDLPELARMFTRHGLQLVHLTVPAAAEALFRELFPAGEPARDLDLWGKVESQHDNLFGSMYHFTLRKTGNGGPRAGFSS